MTEPVAFYDPHKGFYWAQPTKTTAPVVVNVEPLALYTQRTWVGLTDDEQFMDIEMKGVMMLSSHLIKESDEAKILAYERE